MTTKPRRQWSETNRTGELRNFRFHSGIVYGTIFEDFSLGYKTGMDVIFRSFQLHEYKDHYFIVTGSFQTRRFWLAEKKYEKKILNE